MTVKKGDKVKVLTGKDKGKEGVVITVLRQENKIVVDGLNVYKRNVRNKKEKGTIVEFSAPMHASNVKVIGVGAAPAAKKTTTKKSIESAPAKVTAKKPAAKKAK